MEDNEEFEQAIQSFSDEIKEIARETRKLIYKVLPKVVEVVWIRLKKYRLWNGAKEKNGTFLLANASNETRKLRI